MSYKAVGPYVSHGKPCTPRQAELLTILMEECAEVIQAASKLVRFGVENRPAAPNVLDLAKSNVEHLSLEIGDLLYMLAQVDAAGLCNDAVVGAGMRRKRERLEHYLQSEPDPT